MESCSKLWLDLGDSFVFPCNLFEQLAYFLTVFDLCTREIQKERILSALKCFSLCFIPNFNL